MEKITFNEYCGKNCGCVRLDAKQECPHICVIPAYTVETVANIKGFADCFVHVSNINTTYYIDDKHRIITTWAGDLEIDNYDYETNELGLRSQTVYDFANNRGIRYNKLGEYRLFTLTEE